MLDILTLDISNTKEVDEDLYEAVLYAFCKKARAYGIDPATVSFDEWTIQTTVKEYDNAK